MPVALGLDLGTTSISAVAVAQDGRLVGRVTKAHRADVSGLPSGHAEQSPTTILDVALEALREIADALTQTPVCLGITGQMHGVVLTDETLTPLSNLITWQDKRPLEIAGDGTTWLERFRSLCNDAAVRRTGCNPSAGYLGVTLFTLDGRGDLPVAARNALLLADWVAATLAAAKPLTDRTNAASTGLYDLEQDAWSSIVDDTGVLRALLPDIAESGAILGGLNHDLAAKAGLPIGLPIACAIGDHQAAVLGSLPAGESAVHINIGTGGQVSLPVSRFLRTATSDTRYLPDGRYLLVGAGLAGGDAYAWVRRTVSEWLSAFGVERSDDEVFETLNRLAERVPPGCEGLRAEPFFRGTRREPERRAVFSGVSGENFSPGHVARAVFEGIAAALAGFADDHARRPEVADRFGRVIATGNAVRRNPLLAASLARAFQLPVFTSEHEEEAAYGAAVLAGLRAGVWKDLTEVGATFRLIQAAAPSDTN
ncbi:MAG: hypothetical protein H0T47_13725 [Planctomycetaceae bacterium]|nr:hypothetical protein [Planctomycetaceae bacterium]